MKATFIETSGFTSWLRKLLQDDDYLELQVYLLANPEAGERMPRTGGFRKLRWAEHTRRKGRRGGLRIIYYWFAAENQFWMMSIYSKGTAAKLTSTQETQLKKAIQAELSTRAGK